MVEVLVARADCERVLVGGESDWVWLSGVDMYALGSLSLWLPAVCFLAGPGYRLGSGRQLR